VLKIHSVATINNVQISYFTQLKMCYLMKTFLCPSDILITYWLFAAWWSTWFPGHMLHRAVNSQEDVWWTSKRFLLGNIFPSCEVRSLYVTMLITLHWSEVMCKLVFLVCVWAEGLFFHGHLCSHALIIHEQLAISWKFAMRSLHA